MQFRHSQTSRLYQICHHGVKKIRQMIRKRPNERDLAGRIIRERRESVKMIEFDDDLDDI